MTPSVKMMSFVATRRFSCSEVYRTPCADRVRQARPGAPYDDPVLIFLLLGWVPWPLLLALAVVMWLTVVELLEWRPHTLVVLVAPARLPDELRRLPVPAGLPCLPAIQARTGVRSGGAAPGATSATGRSFRLRARRRAARRVRLHEELRAAAEQGQPGRGRRDREGDRLRARQAPDRYLPQGVPPVYYWAVVLHRNAEWPGVHPRSCSSTRPPARRESA